MHEEEQISWGSAAALLACFARYNSPTPQARAAESGDKFLCLFDVIDAAVLSCACRDYAMSKGIVMVPYSSIVQAHPVQCHAAATSRRSPAVDYVCTI